MNSGPHRTIVATAPTRIDFGGGWTDVPPYSEEAGGFVCNLAIERRATVRLRPLEGTGHDAMPRDALAAAALRRAGLSLAAQIESDFPVGAGLGGSSAAGVALQAAIAAWTSRDAGPDELVRRSRAVEVEELGIAGGWQDHCAAAHGGALGIRFEGQAVIAEPIPLTGDMQRALAERLVVVYTGESRISGETITAVRDAWRRGDTRVVAALDAMKALARDMASALPRGDVDSLGALVREHWLLQRSLHPGIPTARIDAIIEAGARAGALGAKALGASGGGCVVLVAPAGGAAPIREAVSQLGTILDAAPAMHGATSREESP